MGNIYLTTGTKQIILAVEDLSSNIIAHYKLNDNGANTTIVDATGNYNGTLEGGDNTEDLSAEGKINECLHLNGTDDALELSGVVTPLADDTVGSVCFWMKPDTDSGDNQVARGKLCRITLRF